MVGVFVNLRKLVGMSGMGRSGRCVTRRMNVMRMGRTHIMCIPTLTYESGQKAWSPQVRTGWSPYGIMMVCSILAHVSDVS
jgi:hypothetical protein